MRRLLALGAVAFAAALAGCGHESPAVPAQQICINSSVNRLQGAACRPVGYAPAAPPKTRSLTGSSIVLDTKGAHLIEGFEGFRSCPYFDVTGTRTRGYGETNFTGGCISQHAAELNLVAKDDRDYLWPIRELHANLSSWAVDALGSFLWNVGPGAATPGTTLAFYLNHGELFAATQVMKRYVTGVGVGVLQALVTRRRIESEWLLRKDPPAETASEHRSKLKRELAADQAELVKLRKRLAVVRFDLGHFGCAARRHQHKPLGTKCKAWFAEGDHIHAKGDALDAAVKKLKRELG